MGFVLRDVCMADTAFPAQLPKHRRRHRADDCFPPKSICTSGITPFSIPTVEETTDVTVFYIERLQGLLTDTPIVYADCQIDNLL